MAQEVIRTPLQTLYGHDQRVTCVAMSWELDMAVSGSQVRVTKPLKYIQGVKLRLIQAPMRLNFSLWRPNPKS